LCLYVRLENKVIYYRNETLGIDLQWYMRDAYKFPAKFGGN